MRSHAARVSFIPRILGFGADSYIPMMRTAGRETGYRARTHRRQPTKEQAQVRGQSSSSRELPAEVYYQPVIGGVSSCEAAHVERVIDRERGEEQ